MPHTEVDLDYLRCTGPLAPANYKAQQLKFCPGTVLDFELPTFLVEICVYSLEFQTGRMAQFGEFNPFIALPPTGNSSDS